MAVDTSTTSAATPDSPEQLFGKRFVRKLFIPLVLAVLAYAALLLYGDAAGVARGVGNLPAITLLFGVLLSLASFALRGLRWQYYLRTAGIRVPLRDSIPAFLIGLGMSITPGKVGELFKSLLLKESCDVAVARSAPIIIAERLMDLAALVALGGLGFTWARSPALGLMIGAGTISVCFAFGKSRWLVLFVIGILAKIPRVARYRDKLLTAHASLYELWGTGPYLVAMILSLSAWGLQAIIVVLFANSFADTSVSLTQALVAYSAPLLAGALTLLPGGLGFTEASMAGALHTLSGVSPTTAATLTILVRGVTFWLAVVIGFGTLAIWRVRRRASAR